MLASMPLTKGVCGGNVGKSRLAWWSGSRRSKRKRRQGWANGRWWRRRKLDIREIEGPSEAELLTFLIRSKVSAL